MEDNNSIVADVSDPTLSIPSKPVDEKEEKKKFTITDLFQVLVESYNDSDAGVSQNQKVQAQNAITRYFDQEVSQYESYNNYNVLILYDSGRLVRSDADKIYNSITNFPDKKPVLLVLYSGGGEAGTAYLIGKLCREHSDGEFSVAVPRRAKSAATLICCAANQIHMGGLSELGPIDPQIDNLPALGLKNSVEHIAEMAKKFPESSDMLAKYLHLSLKPIDIGYYERVAESALQYADRLLETHSDLLPRKTKDIAFDLVYKYKDHGFVIDREEAESIFGNDIVKADTDEYEFANALYKALDTVQSLLSILSYNFYHIGSLSANSNIRKRSEE